MAAFVYPSLSIRTAPLYSSHQHHNHNRGGRRRLFVSNSVSDSPTTTPDENKSKLPIRSIPGGYGLPLLGAIKDRLDYFYFQGTDGFFNSRISEHKSTVFRANMPPGPPIASDPKVVVLLDAASFPILFDVSKVEKKDVFTGTYMPSTDLTGGYRVLSYLDPSEPKHAQLKNLIFYILSSRRQFVIPEFRTTFGSMFESIDREIEDKGKADFGGFNDKASFVYVAKSLYGTDPADTSLKSDGPDLIVKWLLFQLSPILTLGLPFFLEDPLLHTFTLPGFLIKSDYQRLYDFFLEAAGNSGALDEAERLGLSKEEACHNILFSACFNTYGGMKIFFPAILKWVGSVGPQLHAKLAAEIRDAVRKNGGQVTMAGMENDMPLMKSVVYEAFRIEPPVPLQYAKAKEDIVIQSHDAAYQVKKGEMLFGYQPFATKDGRVFKKPETFLAERFLGEEGERLLKYVVWSNGSETDSPTTQNKQCAGKEFVVMMARLLLVEIFLRYDTFAVAVGGSSIQISSLTKRTDLP